MKRIGSWLLRKVERFQAISLSIYQFRDGHSSLKVPLQVEEYELFRMCDGSKLLE